MSCISSFKRFEKKYMLDEEQYKNFIYAVNEHMKMDGYGEHTISNIYFDTDNFDLIRNSLEKPVYKEKLRLRTYGMVDTDTPAFFEIKKKFDGIVYKRRIEVKYGDILELINTMEKSSYNSLIYEFNQIYKEINYFYKIYNPKPKVVIAYDRCAYYSEDSELRLTIDKNIRFRDIELDLRLGSHGINILPSNYYIVEIKSPDAMPMWLVNTISNNQMYPTSYSKYGEYYKFLLNFKGGNSYVG